MTEFFSRNKECSYLKEKKATTMYRIIDNCDSLMCKEYILHGWRRFGKLFFTPQCTDCNECKSMRIKIKEFEFTKSMKRVLKENIDTKVIIRHPTMSKEHLELYDKYHLYMKDKRDWDNEKISANDYYNSFVLGHGEFGYELLYFIDEKLVGVALIDILPNAISSIYCYYDHNYQKHSIGTFSILKQIMLAKSLNIEYLYLGYWVEKNDSLKYKSRFKPHEILQDGFEFEKEPVWK